MPERACLTFSPDFYKLDQLGFYRIGWGKVTEGGKERRRQQARARARRAGAAILHLRLISHPSNPPSSTSLRDLKAKRESRLPSEVGPGVCVCVFGGTFNPVPELLEVQQPQLSGLCCVRVGETSGSSKRTHCADWKLFIPFTPT